MAIIKAYAWAAQRVPVAGIVPLIWVDTTDRTGSADFVAGRIATQLLPRPAEDRALLVFQPTGYSIEDHIRKHTLHEVLAHGMDLTVAQGWYREFFTGLQRRGADLAVVVMDDEAGIVNWGLEKYTKDDPKLAQHLHEVWADSAVQLAMPEALRRYTAEMVLNKERNAVNAWNDWVTGIHDRAMGTLVCGTYTEVFGKQLIASNWNNVRGAFPLFDSNGWPIAEHQVSDWSSPECYIGWWGFREGPTNGNKKDPFWNRFIDCLNYVRSCTAYNGKCMPWISYRSWLDPEKRAPQSMQWLWEQLVRQVLGTGVEKILYWNPKIQNRLSLDADDRALGQLLAGMIGRPHVVRKLEEIPLDVDFVTTAELTTRYADYADMKRKEAASSQPATRSVP